MEIEKLIKRIVFRYKLAIRCVGIFLYYRFINNISFSDILPYNTLAGPETKEFLLKVIDVLLDFIKASNDRNEKVLEFHHPEDMKRLLDLDVPDTAVPLQQLIQDCATTLKYQVKTGKFFFMH